MDHGILALNAQLFSLQVELQGMLAENELRERQDYSQAYCEDDFFRLKNEVDELVMRIRSY